MAGAGFWTISAAEICFGKDGKWYADGEPISNRRIARLFSRHVQPDGDGGWVIDIGIDRQAVRVEDTPLVVVRVDGDPQEGFWVTTNDGERSELNCSSLWVGEANVLYCDVDRGGRGLMPARFLRPAYYQLARFVEQSAGGTILRCRDRAYPLGAGARDEER
ncbi:MAG: hypothetical protein ACE5E4_06535 [Candidatus Binatia bacterium]